MSCAECAELATHEFATAAQMVHAFQVAAAELDRGVLRRLDAAERSVAEEQAVHSALESSGLPGTVRYRFACTTCGDRFELWGDTASGRGGWTRG